MEDEIKSEIQKCILPIIVTTSGGRFRPIGTGFIICSLGRYALMMSAAHNFDAIVSIDQPIPKSHPTTPSCFLPKTENIILRRTKMQAIYSESNTKKYLAEILKVYKLNGSDIALGIILLQEDVPHEVLFEKKIKIDTTPVMTGKKVLAIGYSKYNVKEKQQKGMQQRSVIYSHTLQVKEGEVTELYRAFSPSFQKWPSFQSTISFDSGMSGGPIIYTTHDEVAVACGIVTSDLSIKREDMKNGSGDRSIASMIWPAMEITIEYADINNEERTVKLIDLVRDGRIDDVGKAHEHIRYVNLEKDKMRMIWE